MAQSLSQTMELSHPGANLLREFFATPDRAEAFPNQLLPGATEEI
jgi:hypothetical protein